MDVQTDVGVCYRDVRPVARLFPELVDNGILHLIADELGMPEFFREDHSIDGERLVVVEVGRPVCLFDFLVDVVSTISLEVSDGF